MTIKEGRRILNLPALKVRGIENTVVLQSAPVNGYPDCLVKVAKAGVVT